MEIVYRKNIGTQLLKQQNSITMKAEKILEKIQKMYRKKKFTLDEQRENIMVDTSYTYQKSGEYFSDESYTETAHRADHFCTVEFAHRMFQKAAH